MKRHYRMHICISPLHPAELKPVLEVIGWEWSKPEKIRKIRRGAHLFAEVSAEHYLSKGESEEAFAERMSVAIWKRLGRFVKVTIDAVLLDEAPNDSFEFGEYDYQRLVGAM